ncbi:glycosyltransferase [Herbaspirillum rubrisubalbicans]|uniref:Glycosyltransferase family 1 protein n=1 Tax=Herbaspirillum rubrisubalbicans TaxID=80842 RepID=A0AAD0U5A9_9BURK|nr:glycosyltransferase [Herbaspirillum rubrisubalbicans]AYR23384.1 glycosyltransferase family 1 protein [Herbaspirillum rubrisubalbicans]
MTFFYLDSGLATEIGHHANSCRLIIEQIKKRGMTVEVYGHVGMEASLKDELNATPYFRWHTYNEVANETVWGRLDAFRLGWRHTFEDLRALSPFIKRGDLVYFNSVRPAQLMALALWIGTMDVRLMPTIVAEFGSDSGLQQSAPMTPDWMLPDLRHDIRPLFYRIAADALRDAAPRRLHLLVFDEWVAKSYSALLGLDVNDASAPRQATTDCRRRTGLPVVTIGILGEQRPAKGYEFVPEVIQRVLDARPQRVKFLVHNAVPEAMPQVQARMREMALQDSRIELDEQPGTPARWNALLGRSDLMLCPYFPGVYQTSYSAIAIEALANAIPAVVPAGTTLSHTLERFSCATSFGQFEASSIADAVIAAVDRMDELAEMAKRASKLWAQEYGPGHLVRTLLGMHERFDEERQQIQWEQR